MVCIYISFNHFFMFHLVLYQTFFSAVIICFHSWKGSTNEHFDLNHMLITYMYTFRGNSFLPLLQFTTKLNKWISTQRNRIQKMLDLTLNFQRMGLFSVHFKSVNLSWSKEITPNVWLKHKMMMIIYKTIA